MLFSFGIANAIGQDTRNAEFEYADKKLNIIYRKIMFSLNDVEKNKLRRAQRAWIVFRDLDCAWAFDAEPIDCMIDRTDNRTRELKESLFSDIQGRYLSVNE